MNDIDYINKNLYLYLHVILDGLYSRPLSIAGCRFEKKEPWSDWSFELKKFFNCSFNRLFCGLWLAYSSTVIKMYC